MIIGYGSVTPCENSYTLRHDIENELFRLINELRTELGLTPFSSTHREVIYPAAVTRANEISTSFSHTRPNGSSCGTAFRDMDPAADGKTYVGTRELYDYYRGENIVGTNNTIGENSDYKVLAQYLFDTWKNSPGHYNNMTDPSTKYSQCLAVVECGNGWVYAEWFKYEWLD